MSRCSFRVLAIGPLSASATKAHCPRYTLLGSCFPRYIHCFIGYESGHCYHILASAICVDPHAFAPTSPNLCEPLRLGLYLRLPPGDAWLQWEVVGFCRAGVSE